MEQSEGFEIQGNQGEELVCKLLKSLYGLKQAGHNWNKEIDQWLKKNKMKAAAADSYLYIFQGENSQDFLALALYVDDILIIDNNIKVRESLIKEMTQKFKMVNLGEAKWILGTRITHTANEIKIDQQKYLQDILERYEMKDCKAVSSPAVVENLESTQESTVNKMEYMSMVGSLIYLSVISRPDIAYAVSRAGQAMANPTAEDFQAVKRILRYLQGTKEVGI
jgi:hypothetical protein